MEFKEYKMWLTKMYYENCKEREQDGVEPFESVDAYHNAYSNWLRAKYKEFKGEE